MTQVWMPLLLCAVVSITIVIYVVRLNVATLTQLRWKRFGVCVAVFFSGLAAFFASEPLMRLVTRLPPTPKADPADGLIANVIGAGVGATISKGFAVLNNMVLCGFSAWFLGTLIGIAFWKSTPAKLKQQAEWYQ